MKRSSSKKSNSKRVVRTQSPSGRGGIGSGNSQRDLIAKKRHAKGECVTCGRKTHKIKRFPTASRTPLTIEGEVITGICLKCNPIEGYARRDETDLAGPQAYAGHEDRPKIPNFIDPVASRGVSTYAEDDTGTLISGLTLDPIFRVTDNYKRNNQHNNASNNNDNSVASDTPTTEQQHNGVDDPQNDTYDGFRSRASRASPNTKMLKQNSSSDRETGNGAAVVERNKSLHHHMRSEDSSGSFEDSGIVEPGSSIRDLEGFDVGYEDVPATYDDNEKEILRKYQRSNNRIRSPQPNHLATSPYDPITPFSSGGGISTAQTPNADNRRHSGNNYSFGAEFENNRNNSKGSDMALPSLSSRLIEPEISDDSNDGFFEDISPPPAPPTPPPDDEIDDPPSLPRSKLLAEQRRILLQQEYERMGGEQHRQIPDQRRTSSFIPIQNKNTLDAHIPERRHVSSPQQYLPQSYTNTGLNNSNSSDSHNENELDAFIERDRRRMSNHEAHLHQEGFFPPSVSSGMTGRLSQEEKVEIEEKRCTSDRHPSSQIKQEPHEDALEPQEDVKEPQDDVKDDVHLLTDQLELRRSNVHSDNDPEEKKKLVPSSFGMVQHAGAPAEVHPRSSLPDSSSSQKDQLESRRIKSRSDSDPGKKKNRASSSNRKVQHAGTPAEVHPQSSLSNSSSSQALPSKECHPSSQAVCHTNISTNKNKQPKRVSTEKDGDVKELESSRDSSSRLRNASKVEKILDDLSSAHYPSDEKLSKNRSNADTFKYNVDRDTTTDSNKNLQKLSEMYSEDLSRTISALKETDLNHSHDSNMDHAGIIQNNRSSNISNNMYDTIINKNEALQLALDRDASLGYDQQRGDSNEHSEMTYGMNSRKVKAKHSDIPVIIKCMSLHKQKAFVHKSALEAIFELATLPDGRAKAMIIQNDGIPTILQSIWSHLDKPEIQIRAFNALWALFSIEISLQNEKSTTDPLHNIELSGITDAVMISMQTNFHNSQVQEVGCGTLSCITASKIRGISVEDAGNTQIIVTAVNAMRQHQQNIGVQEWGLRAIFNHCLNYEESKTYFLECSSKKDKAADVVYHAMKKFPTNLAIQEWACRVISCISSRMECSKILATSHDLMDLMLKTLRYNTDERAEVIQQSLYNAFANTFAVSKESVRFAIRENIVNDIINSITFFKSSEKIQAEICAVLANMCVSLEVKRTLLETGVVDIILKIMQVHAESESVTEEACRALAAICYELPIAKDQMASRDSIDLFVYILRNHRTAKNTVEMVCELLCTLTVSQNIQATILEYDYHDEIIEIIFSIKENINVIKQGFCLLRNLSTNIGHGHVLARFETIRLVVGSMTKYNKSEEIQMHACAMFWNLSNELREDAETILNTRMVDRIVNILQSFPESEVIQCVACGSLWSLMVNLERVKNQAVKTGGIDALVVALVMYQNNSDVLKNACGALSSISVNKECLQKIAAAGSIGSIIETMRNNVTSASIITYGSIFLRNVSIAEKNYAEVASACASTIIRGMRQHLDDIYLQKECIGTLLALALFSSTCKERIQGAGGVETLEHVMKLYRTIDDIQSLGRETITILLD